MLPVKDLKFIKPREPIQLILAGFLSHRTSPRLMICKTETPGRRDTKRTSGTSDPRVEMVFCIPGISVHRELNPAIKACHLDCVFVDNWESQLA